MGSVCDGIQDCVINGDETLCELKIITCLQGCTCFALAIECREQNGTMLFLHKVHKFPYISVVFFNISSLEVNTFASIFPNLIFLILKDSAVQSLATYLLKRKIILADLSMNNISEIYKYYFTFESKLKTLALNGNNIQVLSPHCFSHLTSMHTINLSENPMSCLPKGLFSTSPVQVLLLEATVLQSLPQDVLDTKKLKLIVTSSYHICCQTHAPTICTETTPWHLSCFGILPEAPMRIMLIADTTLVLSVNLLCICLHAVSKTIGIVFRLSVYSISANEMLYFVYYTITSYADMNHIKMSTIKLEKWGTDF